MIVDADVAGAFFQWLSQQSDLGSLRSLQLTEDPGVRPPSHPRAADERSAERYPQRRPLIAKQEELNCGGRSTVLTGRR